MEASDKGNSNNEVGTPFTNDSSRSKSESSPLPTNKSADEDDIAIQATPAGEGEGLDSSVLNFDDKFDQDDGTEGGKIYVPRKYDVLLGRGRPLQDHPGNLRFHKIINRARSSYLNSRKEGKAGIAKEVLHDIKTSKKNPESKDKQPTNGNGDGDDVNSPSSGGEPGRFLKKVGDSNSSASDVHWVEVSEDIAIEKISHALRGRPRSETSNRSDGPGGSKGGGNIGGEKTQTAVVSRRWRQSKNSKDNTPKGGNPKRKGPPSPPTNDAPADVAVVKNAAGAALAEEKGPHGSSIADAILTTNASTPSKISTSSNAAAGTNVENPNTISSQPLYSTVDNNQLPSIFTGWQLQQFQAALQFQQQNAQQVAQQVAQQQLFQQLVQQLVQQQQQIPATGVGASGIASPFGQNQQQLNPGGVGILPSQQQHLQLLLQHQQALQLLQQQAQQVQPQQVQYLLQQNQLQVQQPQQPQQPQPQQQISSTTQQQAVPDLNLIAAATAMLSNLQQAAGNSIVNPNILSGSTPILSTQQSPISPAQNPETRVAQPGSSQVVDPSSQLQQQIQQLQQQQLLQEVLLTLLNPQQPLQQHLTTAPNSSSSTTPDPQHQPQPPGPKPPPQNKPS